MIDPGVNDMLNQTGGGAPGAKFENVGDVTKGVITGGKLREQTDLAGKALTFPDGKPRMQIVYELATDLRDPSIEDDDGSRRLFVSYKMQEAINEARREAGGVDIEEGGTLAVQLTGQEHLSGGRTAKLYRAQYTAPIAQPGDLMSAPTNGHVAPVEAAPFDTPAETAARQQSLTSADLL
jgi:hypothetical protein